MVKGIYESCEIPIHKYLRDLYYLNLGAAIKANNGIDMELADGLKKILVKHGLTRIKLLGYSASELSSLLNVDEYVAILILNAAKSANL
jgi:hypothetical protein